MSVLVTACSTPTGIVEEAVEAAGRGDRDAYIACFTERSRPLLRGLYHAADAKNPKLAALGEQGARVTGVEFLAPSGGAGQRALVTVSEGQESMPLVVHASAGAWRIDLMDSERVLTGVESRF
ncbi:MAG: hypothetical protein ACPGU1_02645 [Myxococcota bacterium]